MSTPENKKIVKQVVEDFISKNNPFTTYDIVKKAKRHGADEHHLGLKGDVHAFYPVLKNLNWKRSLITLPGGYFPIWLYHPQGYDINDYIDRYDG